MGAGAGRSAVDERSRRGDCLLRAGAASGPGRRGVGLSHGPRRPSAGEQRVWDVQQGRLY